MTVDKIVVLGLEAVADTGIMIMTGSLSKMLTPENASTAARVAIAVGDIAVCGVVCEMANHYIEDYAAGVKAFNEVLKEKKSQRKSKKKEKPIVVDAIEVEEETEE
jgi:hypothetical protein